MHIPLRKKTFCLVWHINTPFDQETKSSSHGHQAQEYDGIQGSPYCAVARGMTVISLLHIHVTLCSAKLLWCPSFVFQTAVKFCKTSHIFTGEILKLIFRVWYFTAWLVNHKRPNPKSRNTEGLMVSINAENQRLYLNLLEYHRTRLIQLSPLLEKKNKYYESIYKKDCHLR